MDACVISVLKNIDQTIVTMVRPLKRMSLNHTAVAEYSPNKLMTNPRLYMNKIEYYISEIHRIKAIEGLSARFFVKAIGISRVTFDRFIHKKGAPRDKVIIKVGTFIESWHKKNPEYSSGQNK